MLRFRAAPHRHPPAMRIAQHSNISSKWVTTPARHTRLRERTAACLQPRLLEPWQPLSSGWGCGSGCSRSIAPEEDFLHMTALLITALPGTRCAVDNSSGSPRTSRDVTGARWLRSLAGLSRSPGHRAPGQARPAETGEGGRFRKAAHSSARQQKFAHEPGKKNIKKIAGSKNRAQISTAET